MFFKCMFAKFLYYPSLLFTVVALSLLFSCIYCFIRTDLLLHLILWAFICLLSLSVVCQVVTLREQSDLQQWKDVLDLILPHMGNCSASEGDHERKNEHFISLFVSSMYW